MISLNKFPVLISGLSLILSLNGCKKDIEKPVIDTSKVEVLAAGPEILSVEPLSNAKAPVNIIPSINFNKAINTSTVTSSTFTLAQGSNVIPGSVYCNGTTVSFTPSSALTPNTAYTVTATTGIEDASGNHLAADYTWSFSTSPIVDVVTPKVVMVSPAENATSIPANIEIKVTFSELMNSGSLTSSTFLLKQGSTVITGNVSAANEVITFTPSAPLIANTLYSVTLTTGIKDLAGNPLATNYSWSFTTASIADVIAPTVISVSPVVNETSVAVTGKPSITFSEPVNPSTVTASSFSLKQGSTIISGTISIAGATATFTPASSLVNGAVYTVNATTGIKDLAGNALASNYSWSFTTVAAPAGKSFSADVVPILNQCNTCHTHGWTPSSTASVFYTNLVSKGYVNPTAPTSGKIYQKVSGGHPSSTITSTQKNTIITWVTEGSRNN
jgi:hypothetical protein